MVASLQLTESCKREMVMIYYAPVLHQLTRASYAVRRKSEEELESCKLIFSQSGTTSGTACTCAF